MLQVARAVIGDPVEPEEAAPIPGAPGVVLGTTLADRAETGNQTEIPVDA